MKKILALLILTTLSSNFVMAKPDHLIGLTQAIKVVVDGDMKSFELCKLDNETRELLSCRYLGEKQFYSVDELAEIMKSEKVEAYLKTGGAVVGGIVIGVVAFYASIPLIAASVGYSSLWAVGGSAVFGVIGFSTPTWLDKTNPWHQFKQANILKQAFITEDVQATDEDVKNAAKVLDQILGY